MNIVIAPDSYKGTLSQVEVAYQMKKAILKMWPNSHIVLKPMADGGEGTLDALLAAVEDYEVVSLSVTGPLGKPIKASFGILYGDTVVIEVASIVGLYHLPQEKRHPYHTSTYGIGEVIKFFLDEGYRKFLLALGGSATNDGGIGLLQALGVSLKRNNEMLTRPAFGKNLLTVETVDVQTIDRRIWKSEITIASDVNNPLCGKSGATYIFGPQKGLQRDELEITDQKMYQYATILETSFKSDRSYIDKPGAGSAGGLGFALLHLGGKMISGAEIIGKMNGLEESIAEANIVFTGEGKSDIQTLYGKAPGYVAKLAKIYDVPCILISGSLDAVKALKEHFTMVYALVDEHVSLEQALKKPKEILNCKMRQILTDLNKNHPDH